MNKMPPIEKIPEALSVLADKRITMYQGYAKIVSSNYQKIYTVRFNDNEYSSNDSATYWQKYPGYPILAVLMKLNLLTVNKETVNLFKDINWKELNDKHKRDYSLALTEITDKFEQADKIYQELNNIYDQLASLDINIKRNKEKKEGFKDSYYLELKVRGELQFLAEDGHRKFSENLIPGVDNILGIRTPILRELAKEIIKDDPERYIKETTEVYFEELMLKGLIIGNMKSDINHILNLTSFFIPKINNWAVCDSFCASLKITKKNKELVWDYLQQYAISNQTYQIRFFVVMMLDYYDQEEYLARIFKIFDSITNDDYYVQMAIAWAISVFFIKCETTTMKYLKNNQLDKFTYNKSLQKIRESLRVNKETKEIIETMKR